MKLASVALVVLTLTGCGTWSRPGATEAEFNRERFECQQASAGMYPVAMASMGGGYQGPSQTMCTGYGNTATCTTTPGVYVPPVQTDQNGIARAVAFDSCMKSKGWEFKAGR